ncbi:elongation factor Ts [Dolosicoccus paucivorans]|uniref:Elongation factor Ts n=1 Tax=Dolosicoccus paucivorans TaxID=84521 RepID=A0A2N6SM78_9LACT|nr:translation elongation factor Ts [Dolosicoccus paucivorans]PMB83581.1 elongation factor Ts [Dolosicoccus paucivorans]PMC58172.1 elongation factor Ts [Dolosicoccus paucivorans]
MAKISAKLVKELRDMTGVGMMDAKRALEHVEGDIDRAVDHLREKGLASAAKKADRIAAEGITASYADGNTAAIIELNSETDFVAKNEQFQTLAENIAKVVAENKPASMEEAMALEIDGQTVEHAIADAINVIGENISFRRFEILTKEDGDAFGEYVHMGGRIGVVTVIEGSTDEEVARDVAMHVAAINPQYVHRDQVPADVIEHEKSIQTEKALNEGKPENIVEKMITGRMNRFLAEMSLTEQPFVKDPDVTVAKYVENVGGNVKEFVRFEVGEGMERREEDFAAEVAKEMRK